MHRECRFRLGIPSESKYSMLVESYVQKTGRQVAARAHRTLAYQFHCISDQDCINAFALPGGHVSIGRGLINLMTTEDELTEILGHEIE